MSTTRSNASRLKEIDQRLNAEKNFIDAVAAKRSIGEVIPYEGALKRLRQRYDLLASKTSENSNQESARLLEDVVAQIDEMKKVFADKAELKAALEKLELESLFQDSNSNSANSSRRNSTLFSNNNNNTVSESQSVANQFMSEEEFFKSIKQSKRDDLVLDIDMVFKYKEEPQTLLYFLKTTINTYIKLAVRFIGLKDEANINAEEKINQAISAQKTDVKDSHKAHRLVAIRALLAELKGLQNSVGDAHSITAEDGASILTSLIASFKNTLDAINAHEDNKFGDGSSQTFIGSTLRKWNLSNKPSISEIFTKYKAEKPALERMARYFVTKSNMQAPKPGSSTRE